MMQVDMKQPTRLGRFALLAYAALLLLAIAEPLWQWRQPLIPPAGPPLPVPTMAAMPAQPDRALLDAVLAHNLWDQGRGQVKISDNAATGSHGTDSHHVAWVLKAVAYSQMQAPVAMVAYTDAPDKVHAQHEGDHLRDGSYLAQIIPHGVVVEKDGSEKTIYLFGKNAAEKNKLNKKTAIKQHLPDGQAEGKSE